MGPTTIYLVSGANRGIGLAFVTQILSAHPTAYVYAGARNPDSATELHKLHALHADRMAIVKLVSADSAGNAAVAQQIGQAHGRVDTVIANAGINSAFDPVDKINPDAVDEHFHVNVTGTIVLFQAVVHLLKKSTSPRFIPISSSAGRIGGEIVQLNLNIVAYGSSKAALNWATRKIHFENEWLVTFPVCPGPVKTDMFTATVQNDVNGVFPFHDDGDNVTATPDTAATSLLGIIDNSTREKEGGRFIYISGEILEW